MDVWNYILGYRNTLKSVFETWVVHIPFNDDRHERKTARSTVDECALSTEQAAVI